MTWLLAPLLLLALAACGPAGPGGPGGPDDGPPVAEVKLAPVVDGLEAPVAITNAGDERLFVAERVGRVRIVVGGELVEEPYLDITDNVEVGSGEGGMLGLAFPPDHATSGRLYVYYTDADGGVLSRFRAEPGASSVDPGTEERLVEFDSDGTNHYGGQLAFGPGALLYWAVGDGGEAANAQDLSSIRGKILRLDVSGAGAPVAPPENPFVGVENANELVWAYGLRNPWRFSFDGDRIFIADVGESDFEELNVVPAGGGEDLNFGWPIMEGPECVEGTECDEASFTSPVLSYPHGGGASMTGGYVYRGAAAPALAGHYVFADFVRGELFTARESDGWQIHDLLDADFRIATLGVGSEGQLYVADFDDGTLYELTQ